MTDKQLEELLAERRSAIESGDEEAAQSATMCLFEYFVLAAASWHTLRCDLKWQAERINAEVFE